MPLRGKKILLLFSMLLCFLGFSINAKAATWTFKWTNTIVSVPVGAELGEYLEKPIARLYKDNMLLADAKIDYLRNGDWLYFLKDVNTSVCGEYKVYYKAFEKNKYNPGTCNGYKQIITFKVYDDIKPEVVVKSDEIYKKRAIKNPTEEEMNKILGANIEAKDNYSKCELSFNHDIDLTKIGRYRVDAFATDSEKNIGKAYFYVNVIEGGKPTISYLNGGNELILPLGSTYNPKELFKAFDEIDGDISINLSIPKIDTSAVGESTYKISVLNKAGQEGVFSLVVKIVDDEKPVINVIDKSLMLPFDTNFEEYDFLKHVEITDNQEVDLKNVKIRNNIEKKAGKYQVIYTYSDGVNEVEATLDLILVATQKPTIEVLDIVLEVGSVVDLTNFITVSDSSDPDIGNKLEINDDNVDYNKPGSYMASVSCLNSSGQSETKQFKVIIEAKPDGKKTDYTKVVFAIMLALIAGLVGFIVYYFVIRKKRNTL